MADKWYLEDAIKRMCIDFAPRYTEDGYRESFFEKHLRAAFEAGVAAQKATESSNTTTTAEETA
jgi:hypothetical protein